MSICFLVATRKLPIKAILINALKGAFLRVLGVALEWHSRGQEFDPLRLHHSILSNYFFARFLSGCFCFYQLLFVDLLKCYKHIWYNKIKVV